VVDGQLGTYQQANNLLIFKLEAKKGDKTPRRLVVEYVLAGDRLTLSEDVFAGGVAFERAR